MPLSLFLQKILVKDKRIPVATNNPLLSSTDVAVHASVMPYIIKSNTVGLSIGIINGGNTGIYSYGETSKGNKRLPEADSIFEIGSITKTFTATLLAYFAAEGKLSLQDGIEKYLPEAVYANPVLKGITLLHLSNHTSGLPRLPSNLHAFSLRNPYKNYTEQKLLKALATTKLKSAPGEAYAYSNYGAGLLGVILEKAGGMDYEKLIAEFIAGPLKMACTGQHFNPDNDKLVAVYNSLGLRAPRWDFKALAGCGCLSSTISGLLLFAQANISPPNDTLGEALKLTQQVTYAKERKIGLGWQFLNYKNADYLWHNGGTGGSKSFLLFSPERDVAIVVLSNAAVSCDALAINILKGIG